MSALDFSKQVESDARRRQSAERLVRHERERTGLIPGDREQEAIKRAVAAWLAPYRAEVSRVDIEQARARDARARAGIPLCDMRTISAGRLQLDVRRAVKRWSVYRKRDAPIVEARALALLLQWPSHGSAPSEKYPHAQITDLGGARAEQYARRIAEQEATPSKRTLRAIAELERILRSGTLPERRVWLDAERRDADNAPMLTRGALRALRAAVKQACAELKSELEQEAKREQPSGSALDFSALIDAEREQVESVSRLPRVDMPETVARLMGHIPLDCARALIARAYPEQLDALAEQWQISRPSLDVALSRGRAKLIGLYPSALELLDALDDMTRRYRAEQERRATLELLSYGLGRVSESDARASVLDWRDAERVLSDAERATLRAALAALQRLARGKDPEQRAELAERIAGSSRRLYHAEQARGKQRAELGARGGSTLLTRAHDMARDETELRALRAAFRASESEPNSARRVTRWSELAERYTRVETLSRAERVWTYGLTARDDRDARRVELAELVSAPERDAPEQVETPSAPERERVEPRYQRAPGCRACLLRVPHASHAQIPNPRAER